MNIVVDMNLGPAWPKLLCEHGHGAVHWSSIGRATDPDDAILRWAADHGHVVLTLDHDFSRMVVIGAMAAPSIVQIKTKRARVLELSSPVLAALRTHADALAAGAIITVDPDASRVRLLRMA